MGKETKFIEVNPSSVERTIEKWGWFGWEIMGAPQEIYNKDSHLEGRGDSIYNVTETTHYVKITFQREKTMPNYDELCKLEHEFDNPPKRLSLPAKPKRFGVIFGLLGFVPLIIGLIALFAAIGGVVNYLQYSSANAAVEEIAPEEAVTEEADTAEDVVMVILFFLVPIILIAAGIFVIIWRIKKYPKTLAEYHTLLEHCIKKNDEIEANQSKIISRAKSLL